MSYCVYLLKCGRREYVGATSDIVKRLMQHNGEIAGGARKTKGKKWEVRCVVSGFETWSDALKFEFAVKRCKDKAAAMSVYI